MNATGASNLMAFPGPERKEPLRIVLEIEVRDSDVVGAITLFEHLEACAESMDGWDARVIGGYVADRPYMEVT